MPPARLQAYLEELCAAEGVAVAPGVLSFVVRAGGDDSPTTTIAGLTAPTAVRVDEAGDQDYFERGIEIGIEKDGLRIEALDISQYRIVEVDFDEDLTRANEFVGD